MSAKLHEFVVRVRRNDPNEPWGIRIVGGSDLDTPIIITRVQPGTPASGELMRGDIITKIEDYDGRDLRHEDANNLFKNAGNNIKLAIQRDTSGSRIPPSLSNGSSRCSSTVPHVWCPSPSFNSSNNLAPSNSTPYRSPSPIAPGPDAYSSMLKQPVNNLPHTVFPPLIDGSYHVIPNIRSSPLPPSRDHQQEVEDETAAVINQPYRTTPLVLPGAKVKKDSGPTECYLRHHPNPAMRASPHSVYDHHDVLMKQKVADTVLHRVAGEEAANKVLKRVLTCLRVATDIIKRKVVHKQFNSPIGLYSEANIADTIRRDTGSVPLNGSLNRPQKSKSYKRTVLYDPAKSETYRALQEESYGDNVEEVAVPVQTRVFQPNRIVPGKKPLPSHPAPQPQQNIYANSLGTESEQIHQSGSFKRLMYHVLGETDY